MRQLPSFVEVLLPSITSLKIRQMFVLHQTITNVTSPPLLENGLGESETGTNLQRVLPVLKVHCT